MCTYEIIPKLRKTNEERQGGAILKEKKKEGISIALSNVENYNLDLKFEKIEKRRKVEKEASCDIPAGNVRSLDRLNY